MYLPKIEDIPKQGCFQLIQITASKLVVFANGRVLARLKIRHFQGFTVLFYFRDEKNFAPYMVTPLSPLGGVMTYPRSGYFLVIFYQEWIFA